ncbi:MAG: RNA polymerase sigma-70 factor [Prolixibacteraceae bacterium]|jgi:RNA polymerase sigma-70 factor (ECF subfamily)|nr:RNA polymerase sigma-70 factor [Prolixibacteraceae bacterium]
MLVEDKILFNEIKNRNLKVYEALFSNYYPGLVRFAEGYLFDKQTCEDIVQNIFIYLWENAEKINFEVSVKAYFFQSVKNGCLNHLRNLQIHDRHNLLYIEALFNQEDADGKDDPEIVMQIRNAISKLPDQMAGVFKLKYLEGKKLKEIAHIKQISENTIKTQLLRAKDKLRKILMETTSVKFLL